MREGILNYITFEAIENTEGFGPQLSICCRKEFISMDSFLLGGLNMNILVFFIFTSRPMELQKSNGMLILTCKALRLRARRTRRPRVDVILELQQELDYHQQISCIISNLTVKETLQVTLLMLLL